MDGKRLELLIEAVPAARRIGALTDANGPSAKPDHVRTLKAAAEARGMELSVFEAATRELVLRPSHVAKLRLPAIHQWPEMAEENGKVKSRAYGV